MRLLRRIAALLAVAAVSSGMTLVGVSLSHMTTPAVDITGELPRDMGEIGPAFNQRVQSLFPVGSTVEAMGAELARNGFFRQDWASTPAQEHSAVRIQYGLCRFDFAVYWRADTAERITAVRGTAADTCL